MELTKLSKKELLIHCNKLGLTKCKSKCKNDLIKLINTRNIISNNTNNISPLRYPGGKTRACKIINNILLQYFDINNFDTIISPFFGGGSFEFYLQNNYGLKLYLYILVY
jgi:hypothetical protein